LDYSASILNQGAIPDILNQFIIMLKMIVIIVIAELCCELLAWYKDPERLIKKKEHEAKNS
jgi:hypothetical protein